MAKIEIWRPVPGFEKYQASSLGRIKNRHGNIRKTTLQPWKNNRGGYFVVCLDMGKGGPKQNSSVQRWILMAFTGGDRPGMVAAHKNGDRTDNRIENLYWASYKENTHDKKKHGTWQQGMTAAFRKLTVAQVIEIRSSKLLPKVLAKRFGISEGHCAHIKSGVKWGHLPACRIEEPKK